MTDQMVVPPNGTEGTTPDVGEETVEVLKARLAEKEQEAAKKAELAENYKIRAEKAEKASKGPKSEPNEAKNPDLSYRDIIALQNAKVAEEDFEEVLDYAKFKNVSIAEALKFDSIKATLNLKAEQRRTASATSIGNSARSSGKISDDVLIENARKGFLPTSDEDIERLVNARHTKKKA